MTEPPLPEMPDFDAPFGSFEAQSQARMTRAVTGMGLMVLGGILAGIGRAGLAGSGVILDPQRARQDLKPWSQAQGGVLDDTLRASEVVQEVLGARDKDSMPDEPHVRVRCLKCRTLNDEDARFCDGCGQALR